MLSGVREGSNNHPTDYPSQLSTCLITHSKHLMTGPKGREQSLSVLLNLPTQKTGENIGPQCILGVLCFLLICYYYFRLEFCFQMPVSGSSIATSEKVNKPLQFLRGKCIVEYCSLNTHFIL